MPVDPSSPASSAASLPALASDETQTPVSSNRASLIRWTSAGLPTLPVPISATRMAPVGRADNSVMDVSSQIGDGQVEVGEGEAAVDLERFAGQEAARGLGEVYRGRSD